MFRLSMFRRDCLFFLFGQLGTVFHSRFFAVADYRRYQKGVLDFCNSKKSSVQAGLRDRACISALRLCFISGIAFVACSGFRDFIVIITIECFHHIRSDAELIQVF